MVELAVELLEKPEFQNHVKNIIENGDTSTLTASQIRNELEVHYGLEKDALKQKPYKKTISEIIDKVYTALREQQDLQQHTPATTDSSREASPVKPSPQKRKAASPDRDTEQIVKKKVKVESDNEDEEDIKPKRYTQKKKLSRKVVSDSEEEGDEKDSVKSQDEEMNDASDGKEEDDDDEADENDFSTPPPSSKKTTKKSTKSSAATVNMQLINSNDLQPC
ncbi:hypothetical protein G6F42_020816 [Rhizopus arrhizus]|nr:hypothetical protein G6F42_020816 [Rhizopus arrhizus]